MTKFDSRKQRPKLLADSGITILPVTNGQYLLLKGDGYFDLPISDKVQVYDASKIADLQTFAWREGIRSEPQAIDALFMTSALRSFANDDSLRLTIRGKLRSRKFTFNFQTAIKTEKISVDGVQIEVDSGYEGRGVLLLEAKFGSVESFIVRQLYYPYRHLLEVGVTKEITPVLLVYSNKIYSLYAFAFADPDAYQSVKLVRQVHYSLEESKPLPRFADVLPHRKRKAPSGIPFPQADDISKIFDVAELLRDGPSDKEEIAERFQVDPRQGDYYANAAAWIGLVEKSGGQFLLTPEGREFVNMNRVDRIIWLAQRVREMPAFSEAADALVQGAPLDTKEISKLVARMPSVSGTTPLRRASTVRAWISWLVGRLAG
jgi:hypothetical protein